MPLYTFYPCRLDDTSLGFETYELVDDEEAMLRTLKVLDDHASARFVVAWRATGRCSSAIASRPS